MSVYNQCDRLELRVVDDGIGLPSDWTPASEGVGLSVTRERLSTLYPGDKRLNISRRPEGGIEVRIDLPFQVRG